MMVKHNRNGGRKLSDQNKVVRFKKRKNINIGIIVFLILFLYVAINVYIYFTKEQLSIYEVHEGTTAIDNHITGLILRDETIVKSQKAGYITYYQEEGSRIAKNMAVYSVDENGQLYNIVSNSDIPITLSDKNKAEIKHDVRSFENNFSDTNFASVYDFKENAKSTVLDILNSTVVNESKELIAESGSAYTYDMIASDKSGIISYYIDNFESVTTDNVTEAMFDTEQYKRTSLRTTDMMAKDTPIYKIITSETWQLILPLSKTQYGLLKEKENIIITVLEDDLKINAALTLKKTDSGYYANLTIDKYLSNFLGDRYLDVEINFDSVEGLKIPVTSVVERDFSVVPKDYLCYGGDSNDKGLIKKTYSKDGEIKFPFTKADVYYEDDNIAYVDAELFEPGTTLKSPNNNEEFTIAETKKLNGVYNVNFGYAVFKQIEILFENEEYCIINKDTKDGLSAYDHIALDGSTAVEQAIIY